MACQQLSMFGTQHAVCLLRQPLKHRTFRQHALQQLLLYSSRFMGLLVVTREVL
jgi:hypothetical protein